MQKTISVILIKHFSVQGDFVPRWKHIKTNLTLTPNLHLNQIFSSPEFAFGYPQSPLGTLNNSAQ